MSSTLERERTRSHTATCSSCAELLAEMEALERQLGDLPEIEKQPELAARVMERISELPKEKQTRTDAGLAFTGELLKNLSFVVATSAYFVGAVGIDWLQSLGAKALEIRLFSLTNLPLPSSSVLLSAIACLLLLAGFALSTLNPMRSKPSYET